MTDSNAAMPILVKQHEAKSAARPFLALAPTRSRFPGVKVWELCGVLGSSVGDIDGRLLVTASCLDNPFRLHHCHLT